MNRHFILSSAAIATLEILVPVAAFGQAPDADLREQGIEETGRGTFYAVPTVRAFAENDTARVQMVTVSDFDKKNGPDLLTVQSDGMLNLLHNDGEGNLRNAYNNNSVVSLSPNVVYIEAADLNGDGYSDVVAMDTNNSAFLVFLNNADGTFAKGVSVGAGSASGARLAGGGLAVGDVNADGKPDVVTVARIGVEGSTTFSQQTFIGTGDGTFQALTVTDTTLSGSFRLPPGRSISIADMNRDGRPDLVLQLEESSPVRAAMIALSLGAGDGTFQNIPATGPTVNAGPQPASSLTLGDVNGDGIRDAVFLTFSNEVYVALGQPDGSLKESAAVLSNMSGSVLLALGDINKDGTMDLVTFGSGNLGIFSGKGDGTFQAAAQYTGGYGIFQQPSPADFNGDGNLDIAWLDYTNGRIGLYSGNGDGTFSAASPVHPANPGITEWAGNIQVITAADLNSDGNQDVLTYNWQHASAGGPADLYAGLNDGAGRFSFQRALPAGRLQELAQRYGALIIEAATADFNGDRRPDVIFRTQPGLSVLLTNPDGTLSPNPIDIAFPVPVNCMPFGYLTAGDVNGDGFQDIVAAYAQNRNCTPSASTPSGFFVLLGDGAGHFDARFTPFGDAPFFVRVADLNGDSKLDLVLANSVSGKGFNLYVVPGKEDGAFDIAAARTPISGEYISNILAVDYNSDGKQDLVLSTGGTAGPDGSPVSGTEGLLLLPANGDFTFGSATRALEGVRSIWNGTASADFNGDGLPDLVVSTYTKAEAYTPNFGLIVLPNKADGQFGKPQSQLMPLGVAGRNAVVFVADFNKDGAPDVIAGSGLSSPLYLNTGGRQPEHPLPIASVNTPH